MMFFREPSLRKMDFGEKRDSEPHYGSSSNRKFLTRDEAANKWNKDILPQLINYYTVGIWDEYRQNMGMENELI